MSDSSAPRADCYLEGDFFRLKLQIAFECSSGSFIYTPFPNFIIDTGSINSHITILKAYGSVPLRGLPSGIEGEKERGDFLNQFEYGKHQVGSSVAESWKLQNVTLEVIKTIEMKGQTGRVTRVDGGSLARVKLPFMYFSAVSNNILGLDGILGLGEFRLSPNPKAYFLLDDSAAIKHE